MRPTQDGVRQGRVEGHGGTDVWLSLEKADRRDGSRLFDLISPLTRQSYRNSLKGEITPLLSRVRNCFPPSSSSISAS
jgi:hypothetical protein